MSYKFEIFIKNLKNALKGELPGFSAQKLMAPLGEKPPADYLNSRTPVKSSILILLYPAVKNQCVKTVLIVRSEKEGSAHGGQISFPGGGFHELDLNLSETALREAEEEIGVDRNAVSLIGELTPLYIPVSNYIVTPYVGICKSEPAFTIHTVEVKEIIEVELSEFVYPGNKHTITKYIKMLDKEKQVPCYAINGRIIWGATAMIISELSEVIKKMQFAG